MAPLGAVVRVAPESPCAWCIATGAPPLHVDFRPPMQALDAVEGFRLLAHVLYSTRAKVSVSPLALGAGTASVKQNSGVPATMKRCWISCGQSGGVRWVLEKS